MDFLNGQKILMKYSFSTPARKSVANSKEFLSPPPESEKIFVNEIKYGRMLPRILPRALTAVLGMLQGARVRRELLHQVL